VLVGGGAALLSICPDYKKEHALYELINAKKKWFLSQSFDLLRT